jgi:hypothetical protein
MENFVVDETRLDDEFNHFFKTQASLIKKKFESRRIKVHIADDKNAVYSIIENFIDSRNYIKKISFSDSVTLFQLGIFEFIKSKWSNKDIRWPLERSKSGHYKIFGEQPKGRMNLPYDEYKKKHDIWYEGIRDSIISDLTIISANAITLNGEIVSVDGLGNRVSSMIFGPKNVIIIVGKNKIVNDVESALNRVHNIAAPLTYVRHANKHYTNHKSLPCVQKGKCFDCSSPESACMNTVIVRGQIHHHSDRIHLILVNENLGF